jgi:hypothetical protein
VFAAPPTRSEAATLLLAGQLGRRLCSLTPRPAETEFHSQRPRPQADECASSASAVGELGYDFRHLCSPNSVP